MYPLTCVGGFPVPVKAGRFEVVGVRATVETTTSDSRVRIIDDPNIAENDKWGKILGTTYTGKGTVIADIKGMACIDANLETLFPEPVRLRHGSSVILENVVSGSVKLYVR